MNSTLRSSTGARVVAIGFILIVITGNFWLVDLMLGQQTSVLLMTGLQFGVVLVLVGAVMMFTLSMRKSDRTSAESEEGPFYEG